MGLCFFLKNLNGSKELLMIILCERFLYLVIILNRKNSQTFIWFQIFLSYTYDFQTDLFDL